MSDVIEVYQCNSCGEFIETDEFHYPEECFGCGCTSFTQTDSYTENYDD